MFINTAFNCPCLILYPCIYPLLIILDFKLNLIFFMFLLSYHTYPWVLKWMKKRTNESPPEGRWPQEQTLKPVLVRILLVASVRDPTQINLVATYWSSSYCETRWISSFSHERIQGFKQYHHSFLSATVSFVFFCVGLILRQVRSMGCMCPDEFHACNTRVQRSVNDCCFPPEN